MCFGGKPCVIPARGQQQLPEDLHNTHPGIVRMKSLARCYLWWPGLDDDIEAKVKSCEVCQLLRAAPAAAPLHPWGWPEKPWSCIHIDHAGPFMGQLFLIVIDAYSKWMEVNPTSSTSATATIQLPRRAFATHGLPNMLVSDDDVRQRVEAQQSSQKEQHDNTRTVRQFAEGDKVLVKNFSPGPKWKKAHIDSRTGPLSYTIKSEDGVVTRRHVDLLKRHDIPSREEDDLPESAVHAEQNPVPPTAVEEQKDASTEPVSISMEGSNARSLARRSQRSRRTPSYLKDYVSV